MPRVFEVDGAFRAEKQRALQASHGGGRVRRVSEVDEGHRASAAAAAAATQQSQPSEPRAAVPSYSIVPTRTPLSMTLCVFETELMLWTLVAKFKECHNCEDFYHLKPKDNYILIQQRFLYYSYCAPKF